MAKCGYSRITSLSILYGPDEYGGAGFYNLSDLQGIGQLQLFLKHWRTPLLAGNMFRIALSWWQFLAGTSKPILEDTTTPLPHLDAESKYIASIRKFLGSITACLELDIDYMPPLQRANDSYIMDHVLASGKFTKAEIHYVNLCRLYLQVVTVADISTAEGTALDNSFKHGTPCILSSTSKWLKCHQEKPLSPTTWAAWRRACNLLTTGSTLIQPLGDWLLEPNKLRRQWPFYYDRINDTIYKTADNQYTQHNKTTIGHSFNITTTTSLLPSTCIPTDMQLSDHAYRHQYSPSRIVTSNLTTPPTTFDEYLATLDDWETPLYFGLEYMSPLNDTLQSILQDDIIIASDGSAPDKASFGWIMATTTGTRLLSCYGPAYGYKPSSYRAEGYGILSSVAFLRRLIHYHQLDHELEYTHYCDNQGVITNLNKRKTYSQEYPNSTLATDWDVINETHQIAHETNINPQYTHIKGHQDKHKPYDRLPLAAQLNVDADHLADEFMAYHNNDCIIVPRLPHNKAQLHLPVGTITTNIKKPVIKARRGPALLQQIQKTNRWSDHTASLIDWTLHGQLFRGTSHKTTYLKFIHRLLPVGQLVHQYDQIYDPSCPACQSPIETNDHLHQCPATSRDSWRKTFLTQVRITADRLRTPAPIIDIMLAGLSSYFYDLPHPDPREYPHQYASLALEQNQIGWLNFLRGRWTTSWQTIYTRRAPTPTDDNPPPWALTLLKSIWKQWYTLWETRNKERHGHDQTSRNAAAKAQAIREATILYGYRPLLSNQEQFVFELPLATLITRPTYIIRQWITLWKDTIEHGLES